MLLAYKRLEEDWFFKTTEEMNQFILDNSDKNWYFTNKTRGNFVDEDVKYKWCLTVVKPVDGYTMGI